MSELCRHCWRPNEISPEGCPCWGDGGVESERDCYHLGIEARDKRIAELEQELEDEKLAQMEERCSEST